MSSPPAPATRERSWPHWGLIVTTLYVAIFLAITLPVIGLFFIKETMSKGPPYDVFMEWPYWILITIIGLSQFLFLRVPVRLATGRTVARGSVWLPVIVSGFWFGCLILGCGAAVLELVKFQNSDWPWLLIGAAIFSWIAWAVVFFRISRTKDPKELIFQQSRWLLRGSILELLIAVPSHIVARGRADCCAGILTFFGITMGLSVMLLSFGPAVFLLYHA
ncbi:MAG: hypothetical protein WCN98_08860, partial [Verrucomicrobiaceae bacterium]